MFKQISCLHLKPLNKIATIYQQLDFTFFFYKSNLIPPSISNRLLLHLKQQKKNKLFCMTWYILSFYVSFRRKRLLFNRCSIILISLCNDLNKCKYFCSNIFLINCFFSVIQTDGNLFQFW